MASLVAGQIAPDFVLPSSEGVHTRFHAVTGGRPRLVVLVPGNELPEIPALPPETVVISGASPAKGAATHNTLLLSDTEGEVRKQFGVRDDSRLMVCVIDSMLRVHEIVHVYEDDEDWIRTVSGLLEALAGGPQSLELTTSAPVLIIPDVLDTRFRQHLMERLDDEHVQTPAHPETERRADLLIPQARNRLEHAINEPPLLRSITSAVGRALMPQIRRAFGFKATGFEGFRIVCYDVDLKSHFPAHRSNLTPQTQHRRFGLSLNLNDDYEGGELVFPEYAPHRYRAPAGSALVYSASLMQEALPVGEGRRYALVTFLHDRRPKAT